VAVKPTAFLRARSEWQQLPCGGLIGARAAIAESSGGGLAARTGSGMGCGTQQRTVMETVVDVAATQRVRVTPCTTKHAKLSN